MVSLADSRSSPGSLSSTARSTPQLSRLIHHQHHNQHQQQNRPPAPGHSMRTFRSNIHLLQQQQEDEQQHQHHDPPPFPPDRSTTFPAHRSGGCGVSEVLTDSVIDLRLRELAGDYGAGAGVYAAKRLQQQHLQHQRLLNNCADYSSTKAAADLLDFSGDFTDFHSFGSDISGELEKLALLPGWGEVVGGAAEVQKAGGRSENSIGTAGNSSSCGCSEDGNSTAVVDCDEDKPDAEESVPTPSKDATSTAATVAATDTCQPAAVADANYNGDSSISPEISEIMSPDSVLPVVRSSIDVLQSPSSTIDDKRSAASRLRQLAKHRSDFRTLIGSSGGAIAALIPLLKSSDPVAQENAVTAILNLSLEHSNKDLITSAGAIKPLVYALKTGTSTAKQNAACALLNLSMIRDNEVTIGACGAIPPLVSLLLQGSSRGKKDALTTMYKLCSTCRQNKERAIRAGAVAPLLALMGEYGGPGTTEKAMVVLSCLAGIPQGRAAIVEEGGLPVLVEAVQEGGGGSVKGKEFAVFTLLQLCSESDGGPVRAMLVREGAIPPLVALSQSGSASVKHKAERLLGYLREQRHDAAAGGSAGS